MTGPEHYRRAEELLSGQYLVDEAKHAEAHVHALLAVAAATAVRTEADQQAWISVAATTPPSSGGLEPAAPAPR